MNNSYKEVTITDRDKMQHIADDLSTKITVEEARIINSNRLIREYRDQLLRIELGLPITVKRPIG